MIGASSNLLARMRQPAGEAVTCPVVLDGIENGSRYLIRIEINRLPSSDLHLRWTVLYEPGVLKAIGKRDGEIVLEQEIVTAGAPAQIKLKADRDVISANGSDVVHLTVQVLDAHGIPVPNADNVITFNVKGPGRIIGVDNGNPVSHEPFQSNQRQVFNGLCLAIIQSMTTAGTLQITANSPGLTGGSIAINAS